MMANKDQQLSFVEKAIRSWAVSSVQGTMKDCEALKLEEHEERASSTRKTQNNYKTAEDDEKDENEKAQKGGGERGRSSSYSVANDSIFPHEETNDQLTVLIDRLATENEMLKILIDDKQRAGGAAPTRIVPAEETCDENANAFSNSRESAMMLQHNIISPRTANFPAPLPNSNSTSGFAGISGNPFSLDRGVNCPSLPFCLGSPPLSSSTIDCTGTATSPAFVPALESMIAQEQQQQQQKEQKLWAAIHHHHQQLQNLNQQDPRTNTYISSHWNEILSMHQREMMGLHSPMATDKISIFQDIMAAEQETCESTTKKGRRKQKAAENPLSFTEKLFLLLDGAEKFGYADIISFSPDGTSFRVHDRTRFVKEVLPCWFKQSSFASFHRQLNSYSFESVLDGNAQSCFFHPYFCRMLKEQAGKIPRKRQKRNNKKTRNTTTELSKALDMKREMEAEK